MSTGQKDTKAGTEQHAGSTADVRDAKRNARLMHKISELKTRDNITNFYYIARVYAVIFATIGLSVWSMSWLAAAGYAWWASIPVVVLAVISIGASQHQLGGVVHEGTHYILFRNRLLNELASDWLAAFPIYTSTYAFRVHHLAHHQFVNDPDRDPNFDQASESGHWLDFPVAHLELLRGILRLLWPVNLVKYILARARYSALGVSSNPYADHAREGSKWSYIAAVIFAVGVPCLTAPMVWAGQWAAAIITLGLGWLATVIYYLRVREEDFAQTVIRPVISHRITYISRVSYLALLYGGLMLIQYGTGAPVQNYFLLFWILPLFTTFPLFMILREWLQHGNADRGRYTNSRIYRVGPLSRYAVFPFGMDIHLPHHLYAAVPHYNLTALHELMRKNDKYKSQVLIVEGWLKRSRRNPDTPTAIEVLGPDYAPKSGETHVDDGALEHAELTDMDAVTRQKEASLRANRQNNHPA